MADDPKDSNQHPSVSTALSQEFARNFGGVDLSTPEKQPAATPNPFQNPSSATQTAPEVSADAVRSSISPLRTFKDDLAEVIKSEHISTVQVAAAEQEKRSRAAKEATALTEEMQRELHDQRVRRITVTLATALVVVGLSLGIGLYLAGETASTTPEGFAVTPIIFIDKQIEIPTDSLFGRLLGERLVKERDNINLRLGSVVNLYETKSPGGVRQLVDAESFFKLLGSSAPQVLTRTLTPTYLLGVHVFDGNQGFLILQTDNYESAFSGMLEFERHIQTDFYVFFGPVVASRPAIGTTTPAFNAGFVDRVIRNHDARVLYDASGTMRLMYSFVDRNTIVITTNENTFAEVLSRLQSKRI